MSTGPGAGRFDERRLLVALFGAGTAAFAQLYAPQSVLPDAARDLATSASATALIVSAATLGLAVGVLPWAWAADRIGRVRAMTIAMLGATAVGLAVPFAPSFGLLVAGRAVEGLLVAGVPAVAMAYLTEMLPASVVPRAAGTYVAGTSMGGLLGRLVSGGVAELFGWRAGVGAVAVACLIAAGVFVWLAPRDRGPRGSAAGRPAPDGGQADAGAPRTGGRAGRLRALLSPRLLALDAQGLLLMGGFVAVYNYLGFRLADEPFSLSSGVVSLVFLAYLAGTWSSARTGRLVVRHGRRRVLIVSTGVMAAGVVATLSGWLPLVLAGLVVLTAGFFGAHAVASGWTPVVGAGGPDTGGRRLQPGVLRGIEPVRLARGRRVRAGRLARDGGDGARAGRRRGGPGGGGAAGLRRDRLWPGGLGTASARQCNQPVAHSRTVVHD